MERDVFESAHRAVVYLDLLGFAALTESASPPVLSSPWEAAQGANPNPATEMLSRFHQALEAEIATQEPNHSIVFSDCAFGVFYTSVACISFSTNLMRLFLERHVPVRMGLGFGSFQSLGTNSSFKNSSTIVRAMFGGTAVVRAVGAEKCGAKGMRILVHDSFAEVLMRAMKDEASRRLLLLNSPFRSVSTEADYLLGTDGRMMEQIRDSVRQMGAIAPVEARAHYSETLSSIGRMNQGTR